MGIIKNIANNKNTKYKLIWFCFFIVIWESVVMLEVVSPLLMPSIPTIMAVLIKGVMEGDLLIQLYQSISMVILGLLISTFVAIIMAYLDYYYVLFRSLFELLSSMLHPLPGVALLPIIILWVGIGQTAVFVIIIHAVIWSLYINIKTGFNKIEPSLIEVAGNNGATQLQTFYYVLLPNSLHMIITGLQIGWSRGWRALISAEMIFGAISSVGGIGWYMYERRAFMDTAGMFAGIFLVVFVGVLVEQLLFNYWLPYMYKRYL